MNLSEYKNSWALITGASSGIGKEFALNFASKGINLILLARREEQLKEIAEILILKYNIQVKYISFDLNKTSSLTDIYSFTENDDVEILVNNAGFGKLSELNELHDEKLVEMINVNCTAPVLLTKHFTEKMKNNKRGIVIFLGSILSHFPTPIMALYSATKVFNSFLGEGLINELKKYNINSYVLNPGSTDTDFHSIANNNKGLIVRSPEKLVSSFLKSNKYVFNDGLVNKFLIFIKRFLPRNIVYFFIGLFIKRNNKL